MDYDSILLSMLLGDTLAILERKIKDRIDETLLGAILAGTSEAGLVCDQRTCRMVTAIVYGHMEKIVGHVVEHNEEELLNLWQKRLMERAERQPFEATCKRCGRLLQTENEHVDEELETWITVEPCNCDDDDERLPL